MQNEELIKQARESNLVAYLQAHGTALAKKGVNRWQGVEHDSLVVSGNMFVWNSRNIKGNALDYLVQVENIPFREAVERLTGQKLDSGITDSNGEHKRILGYLCQARGIDYKLVTQLIHSGYIGTDAKYNCVFNIFRYGSRLYGCTGDVIGAELHGTQSKKPFKGFTGGSKHGNGFNIGLGLKGAICKRMYVFESAIDLLSFVTLARRKEIDVDIAECLFLSMGGLKPEVLNTALLSYEVQEELVLCVDNDAAGKAFIEGIQGNFECSVMQPDGIYKDWNDRLTGNCG